MHRADTSASQDSKKPSHVRKLNFGQSILTLDGVKQFQGQKDGTLLIDRNVAFIPCTSKDDFVRKWIETHNYSVSDKNETLCVSPVLGVCATKHAQISPVIGNQSKRTRRRTDLYVAVDDKKCRRLNESVNIIGKVESGSSIRNTKRIRLDSFSRKENIRRNLFDPPSATAPSESPITTASPVLLRNSYSYKKRRRKSEGETWRRKILCSIENSCIESGAGSPLFCDKADTRKRSPILDRNSYCNKRQRKKQKEESLRKCDKSGNSYVDSNMNSMLSGDFAHINHSNNERNILCSQKRRKLIEKLENDFEDDNANSPASEKSKIFVESIGSQSSVVKIKLDIEDSPKPCLQDPVKIEIEFSNEDDSSPSNIMDINNDTDQDFSDHIEDVDTQDTDLLVADDDRALTNELAFASCKTASLSSHLSNKDSDETYFSEAEQLRSSLPSLRFSQKISEISSQIIANADSRSSQTEIIISAKSSPRKTREEPTAHLTLIDSAKKRRKPKRGSLAEKLQSAVSRQMSFARMWKHQLKQTIKSNTPVPCVTVYVQECTVRFSRQFLEGVAIEDPFSLLPYKEGSNSVRLVKIMVIPDIVGKVEMNSKGLVEIFSPWETLDNEELILNVTYIRVVPEDEKDVRQCTVNVNRIKRMIVKDFDCPCISTNKMISSCKDRSGKPNVIEKLVTGS